MKRKGYLYEKVCDPENVRAAILNASKGKRGRRDVKEVLAHIDDRAAELSQILAAGEWLPAQYTPGVVHEGTNGKTRIIKKPKYWPDQCVHWAIHQVISPFIYSSFYSCSCGSVPGRGVHYGKRIIEKWLTTDRKNTKYYLKMDIHHFYPSVPVEKLIEMIGRRFKDRRLLDILALILRQSEGLPIGVLLSQLFANFYLTPIDYFIKQSLGAVHYIRYMDDMVIFGRNKRELHRMRAQIAEFVGGYGLELKGNWQVCRFEPEPLDFMGFRFYRDHTALRRAIMLRITRKIKRVDAKGQKATAKDAAAVISYLGWIKHSDSHGLYMERIQPYLHIQKLKNIIRKEHGKHDNRKKRKHRKAARVG